VNIRLLFLPLLHISITVIKFGSQHCSLKLTTMNVSCSANMAMFPFLKMTASRRAYLAATERFVGMDIMGRVWIRVNETTSQALLSGKQLSRAYFATI